MGGCSTVCPSSPFLRLQAFQPLLLPLHHRHIFADDLVQHGQALAGQIVVGLRPVRRVVEVIAGGSGGGRDPVDHLVAQNACHILDRARADRACGSLRSPRGVNDPGEEPRQEANASGTVARTLAGVSSQPVTATHGTPVAMTG